MKKGDILELEIEKYAFEGKGIAKINRGDETDSEKKFVVFVSGSYPGDIVTAQIRKVKKSYAEANIEKIISPSEKRVEPVCKYFGTCGGCKQQNLGYEHQLYYKQEQVTDIFERIGRLSGFEIEKIIPADKTFFYRNKMEFSFSDERWLSKEEIDSAENIKDKNFAAGLHIPGRYDKVLDIDECFLQSEISNGILNFTREFSKENNLDIYSTKTHTGFLRNLVIKQSHHTNELMVNLVTSEKNEHLFINYKNLLLAKFPQITTIVNNVNEKKAQVAFGDFEIVYHGKGFIYESIGDYKFRISPNSFFQTNTLQAKKLYDCVMEYGEISKNDIVYDLYSGACTISIYAANKAKEVYSFETIASSIEDAKENLKINTISNVFPVQADLNKSILQIIEEKQIPEPDIIITDPPRSGMHTNTVQDIISLSPKKVVYVSCNPTTQARDIKLLTEQGYKLVKIKPVDMFPHTYHIENVALLVKE